MFTSRPLQVLLLLACGVTAVNAEAPNAALGAGTTMCKVFVMSDKEKDSKPEAAVLAGLIAAWAEGYFTARNIAGRLSAPMDARQMGTVGGTMSAQTRRAMLVDQCNEEHYQSQPVFFAVEALYDKLQAKGL